MKNLTLISFVGVDAQTNLDDLLKVKGPAVCEFGVLYSDSKSLTNHVRYPSYKFCKEYLDWGFAKGLPNSLHLCGEVIGRYLAQDKDVMDLCRPAWRIQLNLNIKSYPDHEKLTEDICSVIKNQGHTVILQQNKTKEKFMNVFLKKKTVPIVMLHDGSGGFGREITQVSPPSNDCYTGYAGGINPENVSKIVDLIEKNNPNNQDYYIDMESGVRTDNLFSVERCQQVADNLTK